MYEKAAKVSYFFRNVTGRIIIVAVINATSIIYLSLLKKKNIIVQTGIIYPQSANCANETVITVNIPLAVMLSLSFVRISKQMNASSRLTIMLMLRMK